MTRKYKDRYRSVKSIYPDVYKLPEEEIQPMTNIVRYQGNTEEETKDILNKYIKEKEPFWKEMCYIGDKVKDRNENNLKPLVDYYHKFDNYVQSFGAFKDLADEYFKMKKHNYIGLDDYHHCKGNYNATKRGTIGERTAQNWGFRKEVFDKFKNKYYKNLSDQEITNDFIHDLSVNATGRARAKFGNYSSAEEACADYRAKNPKFPKEYW